MTSTDTLYVETEFSATNDEEPKSEVNFLNQGEDDEMEIYGYIRSVRKTVFTWFFIILSLGTLRLVFHWSPHWMLYVTHRKCPLKFAEKVLIAEKNVMQIKSYSIKNIRRILLQNLSLEDVHEYHIQTDITSVNNKSSGPSLTVNIYLHDGSIINVNELAVVKMKKLVYIWSEDKRRFFKMAGLDKGVKRSEFHSIRGFSAYEQIIRRVIYGDNVMDIKLQSITGLIMIEILTPFFIFQVFTLLVWFAELYLYYSCAIILMSAFGVGSSVIQTRKNQKKLYDTVHSISKVTVCRDIGTTKNEAKYEEIPTSHLVPGDIIVIPRQGFIMPCDSVLLGGNCIVNESMLTGESVPVTKTALPCHNVIYNERDDMNHTLFCGTQVLQARYYAQEYIYAVVIRTGFLTTKGSLIRSILYPVQHDFQFDQDIRKFIWILAGVAFAGATYSYIMKSFQETHIFDKIVETLDIITIVVPPALPAAMSVGKYYASKRLKTKDISCINSSVINVAGSVNCTCFDKTGTLTEDGLDFYGAIEALNVTLKDIIIDIKNSKSSRLKKSMACCHSLTMIDNKISGDPLDVKMFESTGWILDEPNVTDSIKFDLLAPTVVKPPVDIDDETEIGLIHQFQFSSSLQRMSVITRTLNGKSLTVYCKGSPEMIKSLCISETVPENMECTLERYTEKGFRVISVAYKKIPIIDIYRLRRLHREEVESNLIFIGFIIFENKLKPQTIPAINELKRANMKIVMLTGDNIQTAVCVAKECGIVKADDNILYVNAVKSNGLSCPRIYYTSNIITSTGPSMENKFCKELEIGSHLCNQKLAITGYCWQMIKDNFEMLTSKIVLNGVIFARMSPDQKQQVVQELQSLGYYVVMCGDGANDCGALRTAHVGISLSELESSVASPFTSHTPDISCVPKVIMEGRCSLVTAFGLFKFMVLYSLIEFFSTALLYFIDSNLSDLEFLYIDICLVVVFGFFFGQGKPNNGPLVPNPPLSSLISMIPLSSLILQLSIMVGIQIIVFKLISQFSWYQELYHNHKYMNYENYAVFTISQFQYIILAVCYSPGMPYREPIYKNTYFFLSILLMTVISTSITLYPTSYFEKAFQFRIPPYLDFPVLIICMGIINFTLSIVIEDFIVNYLLYKLLREGSNNNVDKSMNHCYANKFKAQNSVNVKNSESSKEIRLSVQHLFETDVKCYGTMKDNCII